jgi:phage terminase large subunit-like protein
LQDAPGLPAFCTPTKPAKNQSTNASPTHTESTIKASMKKDACGKTKPLLVNMQQFGCLVIQHMEVKKMKGIFGNQKPQSDKVTVAYSILTRLESAGAPCLYHGGKEC